MVIVAVSVDSVGDGDGGGGVTVGGFVGVVVAVDVVAMEIWLIYMANKCCWKS